MLSKKTAVLLILAPFASFLVIILDQLGFGFFFGGHYMAGESMLPTLRLGDELITNKCGFFNRHCSSTPLQTGEIISFYPPNTELSNSPTNKFCRRFSICKETRLFRLIPIFFFLPETARTLVQRVIGVPGDTVEIKKDNGVFINGKLLYEPYVADKPKYSIKEFTVPEKYYFVLGDNRNESFDSSIFGFVPQERIVGKVVFIAKR